MNTVSYEIIKLKGIVTDIEPAELMNGAEPAPGLQSNNVWTDGKNIHFDDGSTHRVDGYASFADDLPLGAEPIFSLNVLLPLESYWIWVDGQNPISPKVYAYSGTTHHDVTPLAGLTGGLPGTWTGTVLNGVPIINNAIDSPIWWDGSIVSPMTVLPDWPANTSCRSIRAFKFHLLAMDITENSVEIQEKIIWSDGADAGTIPASWTPLPENDAGSTILAATPGAVVDGWKLRDVFVIYKQHSTYTCQYVAGQFVFNFQPLFITTGIQSVNCIVELRGRHWVFADDDVIVHDGNTYQSIIDNKVRSLIFNAIDPTKVGLCHVVADVPHDEIWFCLPDIGAAYCDVALIYSFEDSEWGVRSLPNVTHIEAGIIPNTDAGQTWDDSPVAWDEDPRFWNEAAYSATNNQLIMCAPDNNKMYEVDASFTFDGEDVIAHIERRDWVLGGEQGSWTNVMTRAIYPHITGTPGDVITIHIGNTMVPGEPITWQTIQEYVIPSGNLDALKIDCLTTGRYMNFRFSSVGGNPWALHRIGVEYVVESIF